MQSDRAFSAAAIAYAEARRRKDTRAIHQAEERLRRARHRMMRRELWTSRARKVWRSALDWLAPLARILATATMFAISGAVWSIVDAPDAYAAEKALPAPTWPLTAIGAVVLSLIVAGILTRMFNAVDPPPPDDIFPDPDKSVTPTTEEEWRRAYAESDGDHASYVEWRNRK